MSADGQRFFYVNPLQRRDDHFEDDDPGRRREWFSCACCPPNIMRLIASLGHYIATVAGDVLYLHQLDRLAGQRRGCRRALSAWTSPPATRGRARPSSGCAARPDGECGLAVRIPGWSRDASVCVNGEPVAWPDRRPRVPGRAPALAAGRRADPVDGPRAAADLPGPADRRAARHRRGRARPARVLLRAGRPAR